MKEIPRYVFGQLVVVALVVTVALTLAVWLTRSLRLIDLMVNRGLSVDTFLWLVILLLPTFLGVVLPIATFCAVLFIYNKLTMDSEMVVMRAAGLSPLQLAMPALAVGFGAAAMIYSITLYFQPVSYHAFKNLQADIRNDLTSVLLQDGVFNDLRAGVTVYVRARDRDGGLRGILVHDARDRARPVTIVAERGVIAQSESGTQVVLFDGRRQQADPRTKRISTLGFDRYAFDLSLFQESTERPWRDPKERYLGELLNPGQTRAEQRLRNELLAEGHQRLILPLYAIAFVVVGLATLLVGPFNRRGQTWRVLTAIALVAIMEGLQLALRDLAARSAVAIIAMYAAVLLPTGLGFYMLLRAPRRPPARPDLQEAAS